jgi:hypothetical protein
LNSELPVVAICNISETFFDFLNKAENSSIREDLICGEQYRGDRTLVWLGDPKLVFTTFPIPHADHLCQRFGYQNTHYFTPKNPSPWLSLDILKETNLLNQIVDYAGPKKTVQLVPYATTPQFMQLAQTLQTEHGLTVQLPESPHPNNVWLRDYIDTKVGFHALVNRWLPNSSELIPMGFACPNRAKAAQIVRWFGHNNKSCIVKADTGENGIGNYVLQPDDISSTAEILPQLRAKTFLQDDWIVVEEFISSSKLLSPSLELFVPAPEFGSPQATYLCAQVFQEYGDFCGVLVSQELTSESWYLTLFESGLIIGQKLQELGYIGHFDLDAIVDDSDHIYLLEVNSRRTGGTHVHEFAHFYFGPDYLDNVVLLSNDSLSSGNITNFDSLLKSIDNLLYPINQQQKGVIITVTSALVAGEFGCIIVADSTQEALDLQQQLIDQLNS